MRLRQLLLLTLTTTPLTGCYLHCRRIPEEQFSFTSPVTVQQLDELASRGYVGVESREELSCELVCQEAYQSKRGWQSLSVDSCELTQPTEGVEGHVTCEGLGVEYFCKGRRPLGHVETGHAHEGEALGRTLAQMAHLEAASVLAFVQLAEQLERLRAPETFIERSRAAAEDERRHARWLTALARGRGASVDEPRIGRHADERLDIARHNAVEGCVHEAFAALVAAVIAQHGTDPVLRQIYARIADDEARHGQLAWDLHDWLMSRLPDHQRSLVHAAQREALAQLPRRVGWLAELPAQFGPVSPESAQELAANFAMALAS